MSKLASRIDELLAKGVTSRIIASQIGCSESYVRAVKCGYRGCAPMKVLTERYTEMRNPILPDNSERITRLQRSGMSPWEIAQVVPDWGVNAQPHP